MKKIADFLDSKKEYGYIFLRLVFAWRLLIPVWFYFIGVKSMNVFVDLLTKLNFPFPYLSAYTSISIQFIGSLLILIGFYTRLGAFLLVLNFIIVILTAHLHDDIIKSFPAWALLAMAVSILFSGGGRFSIDTIISKRKKNQ